MSVFRWGPIAWPVRLRGLLVPVLAAALLLVVAGTNLGIGSSHIALPDVLWTLVGGGDDRMRGIIFDLRMPRTLTGALVGAALGLSGAIFQSISRNPLASPDILGISWGAAVGAVGVLLLGGYRGQASGIASSVGIPTAGLVGGLVAGVLLYALSWRRGIDGFRMVLIGIGISAVAANLVYWMLTVGDVDDAARATTWLVGNLGDVGWESVWPTALALVFLAPVVLVFGRTAGALQFGDDTARGLGVRVDAARGGLLLLAAALASVAAAAAGPISFVALATPQIAVRLTRSVRPPLAASMVLGGLLTVAADLLVRLLPGGLPVGALTAVLGAPYLLYLFVRKRREVQA